MSFVVAAPDMLALVAADVADIGSSLSEASAAAAAPTTTVMAAAGDEVSAAITSVFSSHAEQFQALSAQAAAFHDEFVKTLSWGAGSYASTEAASASALENLPGPAGEFATTIGNGFALVEQDFAGAANTVVTFIFGSPANPPFTATQGGSFSGTPSLATRFEETALLPVKPLLALSGLQTQISVANSPLLSLFTGDNPLLSPFLSNDPPLPLTLLLGESVQHTTYNGMTVVQITPAHPSGQYVVAIHGGAFIFGPSIFHWLEYTVMAYQTGATIEVPIYPLLQQGGTAGLVVPNMAGLINMEVAQHGPSNVSVIGDSAGGNLALAAVEYEVAHGQAVPGSMVLVSPWLDVTMTNPNIPFVADPLLPVAPGAVIGKLWAGNLSTTDPMVSPLYGSLSGLPPTYVYSGSMDSLAPDTLVLQQHAVAQGAPISFILAAGQIHDWIILTPDGFQYWPQIDQELGI
jgi:triacylglycerol lipase